eukprot:TRINITY_DN15938_c0_g2_i4.p2 TRINITY_DN15938_c0_g2~~TRINITY_DN15938_c0_g2_i4.p2  ORF type:complete len:153 (-),score=16.55 TRINITY_DN15938_c0_g2_i4:138-596(-)
MEIAKRSLDSMHIGIEKLKPHKETLSSCIPPLPKYMLWAALHNKGPYDILRPILTPTPEDSLLAPKGYENLEQFFFTAEERTTLYDTREKVAKIGESMGELAKTMHKLKKKFLKEVDLLKKVLNQEAFNMISGESVENFTRWIISVNASLTR